MAVPLSSPRLPNCTAIKKKPFFAAFLSQKYIYTKLLLENKQPCLIELLLPLTFCVSVCKSLRIVFVFYINVGPVVSLIQGVQWSMNKRWIRDRLNTGCPCMNVGPVQGPAQYRVSNNPCIKVGPVAALIQGVYWSMNKLWSGAALIQGVQV